jgi:hypothetical protein
VLAAVCLSLGALLPVVKGAVPGFSSAPVLIVLALVPMAVAVGLALTGRHAAAAGLLIGLAVLTPGRLMLDLQFAVDASRVARPELYLPTALENPGAGAGLWFLVAGYLLTAIAEVPAGRLVRAQSESSRQAHEGQTRPGRRRWQLVAPAVAVLSAVGLLMVPMRSTSVYLQVLSPFDGPFPIWAGSLVLACALPLAVVLAIGSTVDGVAKGTLLGLAFGTVAVALPNLLSGMIVPRLEVTFGPIMVLLAAVVLAVLAFLRPGRASAAEPVADQQDLAGEAVVPGLSRLRLTAGVLGVLTAVTSLAASLSALVTSASAVAVPESPARWLLVLAGAIVGVLAVLTLVPSTSVWVRPALSVAWAGVAMAGASVLGTALAATGPTGGYSAGAGVFWTIAAMILATVTAGCSVILGVVEREESEDTGPDGPRPSGAVLTPLAAGAVLALVAFGTPTFTAPEYVAPGLWSDFGTPSWGLLGAALTVLGAAALALRSRPGQAAALLLGAVAVLAVRAAELPVLGGQVAGSQAGIGFWLTLAGMAAFVLAAVLAATGARKAA